MIANSGMGMLEEKEREIVRRTRVNSAIVKTLAVVGVVSVAVLAPNVISVLSRSKTARRAFRKQSIDRSLTRLIEKGYVRVRGHGVHKQVALTRHGEYLAALMGEGRLKPKKPKRWDKKWRLLVFDVPEKRRRHRDQIRLTLTNLGFSRLQDSVWVYPYDCEDFIALVKADLRLRKNVVYIIADQIEGDAALKKHFGLSS